MITGVIVAIVAGFTPIDILSEMTSIGTLFAFVVVSMAVIILRTSGPMRDGRSGCRAARSSRPSAWCRAPT